MVFFNNNFIYYSLRYIFGFIFIFYLPGHSLVKLLFYEYELDYVENIILCIVMSMSITIINAFILNYTIWGLTFLSVSSSLLIFIFIVATIGIINEYNNIKI
ncbi:MAG: DUF1616 domain-containing protein [Candidatus Hodarchaeota archaeon]